MSDIDLLAVDHIDWPNSVISATLATPPGSPADGARYIVAASPTGAWTSHAKHIARWSATLSAWAFQIPALGRSVHNEATIGYLKFDGTNWINDDRVASGLRSASTIVDVSAATAPSTGMVLTAVDSTHATFQALPTGVAIKWTLSAGTVAGPGNEGDFFFVLASSASGAVYQYLSGGWTFIGSLAGVAGSTWRSGSGAPVDATGIDGDWYQRTSTGQIYTRTSGTYTLVNTVQLALTYSTGLNLSGTTLTVLYGSSSTTACVGNDSRLSDDRVASGLRSASTVVDVSAATAPSSGKVLTATDSTHATWQTPAATATAVATTGASVDVAAAAPPSIGKVLTATDATHATWQTPAAGAPTGSAGGSLSGTYPNPDVAKIVETSGPTALTIGTIVNGEYLKRVGSTLVSGVPPGSGGSNYSGPYVTPPTSPHTDNEEFDSGSNDLATRGWIVWDATNSVVLTRAGDIDPFTTPSAGTYLSRLCGSTMQVQVPTNRNVYVYKAVTLSTAGLIWCRCADQAHTASGGGSDSPSIMFGVFGSVSSRPSTIDFVIILTNQSSGIPQIVFQTRLTTAGPVTNSTTTTKPLVEPNGTPYPIRAIRYSSTNTYQLFVANDAGQIYTTPASTANTPNITNMVYQGWRIFQETTVTSLGGLVSLDFSRRIDGASNAWIANS